MNQTGGRAALRRASARSSSESRLEASFGTRLTTDCSGSITPNLREQIADAADAANHARVGRIDLDQLAQPHDEVIDRARGRKFIGRPGTVQDVIATDGLANALGEQPQHRAFLVGERAVLSIDGRAEALEVHECLADVYLAAHLARDL